MSIIQITKIQNRTGNLVDLPQLDEAEIGFASDAKRVFIGKTSPNENIEILTSFSQISFSQIDGSVGNLNIQAPEADQIMAYDGNNWVNRGGTAGGRIDLGSVANLKITGPAAPGYVLETDGIGNLSWTPKSVIVFDIESVTEGEPGVVTTTDEVFFADGTRITITGVEGDAGDDVNGKSFFINVLTPTEFELFDDPAFAEPANVVGNSTPNTGRGVASIFGTGAGGLGGAAPPNKSVQYNDGASFKGDAAFIYDDVTKTLEISGTSGDPGNIVANGSVSASRFVSNIATGTTPLQVSSTTRVPNLNVARSGIADSITTTAATTGNFFFLLSSSVSGNIEAVSNANIQFNAANGTLTTNNIVVSSNAEFSALAGNGRSLFSLNASNLDTGTVPSGRLSGSYDIDISGNSNAANSATTAQTVTNNAQPNITTVGTLSTLAVSGNVSAGNISSPGSLSVTGNANIGNIGAVSGIFTNISGNGSTLSGINASNLASGIVPAARLSGSYDISATSATTAGTVTTGAQPNITSVGTLSSLSVSGGISASTVSGNGSTLSGINASNLASGIVPAARLSGSYDISATSATTAGTVTTGAQPNITSVGTLGNLNVANTITTQDLIVTGNFAVGNLVANSATTAQTVTNNAQPNITSVGTLTNLIVSGNINAGNISANGRPLFSLNASNINTGTLATARLSGTYPISITGSAGSAGSATTAGTVTTGAQPNITSVGTLSSLSVSGGITGSTLSGNGRTLFSLNASNINAGTLSTARLSGTYAINITGSAGSAGSATTAGTVTTGAQPNITSVGTLSSLSVSGGISSSTISANGRSLFSLNASNINTGTLATARLSGTYPISITGSAGTVTTGAQPNITSVGTLSSLSVGGNITATGDITAFASSDSRLKENVSVISNALDSLGEIDGVRFDWKDEHIEKLGGEDGYLVRKQDVGVIAQDVLKILPEVVGEREDGTLAVKYEKIVALLISAIKELDKKHNDLLDYVKSIKQS